MTVKEYLFELPPKKLQRIIDLFVEGYLYDEEQMVSFMYKPADQRPSFLNNDNLYHPYYEMKCLERERKSGFSSYAGDSEDSDDDCFPIVFR